MSNSTDTTTLQPEYLLGMLLSIVSILISTSALLIQKYSAKVEAGKKWYKRWRLFAGVSINTGSEVLLSSFASRQGHTQAPRRATKPQRRPRAEGEPNRPPCSPQRARCRPELALTGGHRAPPLC